MPGTREIQLAASALLPLTFRDSCGESPFWSARDGAFYWADIPAGRIHRWRPGETDAQTWQMPEQVGCIVEHSAGGLLAACETGIDHVKLEPAFTHERRANIQHPASAMRFNDGRCDRHGRLWVTTFMMSSDKHPIGGLFCYSPAGLSGPHLDGFMTPNGMAFSPDNRTMYISDSHASVRKVWAVDFDLDNGTLGARRLFIDMAAFKGRPDGAAIDTDGCYWVAGMDDGCIYRFSPSGELDHIVRVPMKHPTMCSFGGPDMKTMFVTSLKRDTTPAHEDPFAGSTLCFESSAQGIAEIPYSAGL